MNDCKKTVTSGHNRMHGDICMNHASMQAPSVPRGSQLIQNYLNGVLQTFCLIFRCSISHLIVYFDFNFCVFLFCNIYVLLLKIIFHTVYSSQGYFVFPVLCCCFVFLYVVFIKDRETEKESKVEEVEMWKGSGRNQEKGKNCQNVPGGDGTRL